MKLITDLGELRQVWGEVRKYQHGIWFQSHFNEELMYWNATGNETDMGFPILYGKKSDFKKLNLPV